MSTLGLSVPEFEHGTMCPAGNASKNSTHLEPLAYFYLFLEDNIVRLVAVFTCLLGLVGNGIVIWLLGFCMKRSPFSVYILNLACADFTFLLVSCIWAMYYLLPVDVEVLEELTYSINLSAFLVGLSLLMVLSTERCVSVLCPIWYRCHRPKHLSSILCALIWGVGSCLGIWEIVCEFYLSGLCTSIQLVMSLLAFITFLVLCVSSLILFIRVQCRPRKRKSSRLYLTLLLNVLTYLILALPYSVWYFVSPSRHFPCGPYRYVLLLTMLLLVLNSTVNPVIYFFVGRQRQPGRPRPLQEVLQRALMDEEEGEEQGSRAKDSSRDCLSP